LIALAQVLLAAAVAAASPEAPGAAEAPRPAEPAVEEPEIVAQDGPTYWYATDVVDFVQETYLNQCDKDVARLAPGTDAIVKSVRPIVICSYRIPYGEGILDEYLERSSARQKAPPSQRRTDQQIWADLVKKYPARGACAKGFAPESRVGVSYLECNRSYRGKEACPLGGEIRVADGRLVPFTERPEERKCSRDTTACPAGFTALPKGGLAGLVGCYRCPAGELDSAETQAWRRGKLLAPRVLCRARRS
jgi:hypothetical protein